MADSYHHGVRVTEVSNGTRTIRTVSTSVIGIVCTAADADEQAFPFNTPVLITDVSSAVGKAGALGTLAKTLTGIADQASPVIVAVRVPEGKDDDETAANVIGTTTPEGLKTGLQALLIAQSQLGIKPRIVGCPLLDTPDVAAAIVSVCQKLRAFGYVAAHGCSTVTDASAYRQKFGAREVMVIHGDFTGLDARSKQRVELPAIARALGLRAKIDQEQGWHKTLSNVPVNGVTGVSRPVSWDLQSPNTDAGYLNAHEVTALINQNGFRFWGSRTCDTDGLFSFESYARTAQIIADTVADAHMWAIDKTLTPSLAKDIVEGVNAKLREWVANGYLLGGKAWYDETLNDKDTLKAGKLRISYDYTPVPPLEDLGFQQQITDSYLMDFASRVNS